MAGKSLKTLINWKPATRIAGTAQHCLHDACVTRRTAARPAMKS